MESVALMEWLHELPKIELHAHLNGSIRDSTLLEIAKELGEKGVIVFDDVKHVIMKNGRSLPECFSLFDLYHALATDHEKVTRITKEVVEDFAAENVVYLELRTTPKKNEPKGMTKHSYMKAVIDGLRAVNSVDVDLDCGFSNENCLENVQTDVSYDDLKRKKIYVRLLLSIDRRESAAAALETVNLAKELKSFGVVGIDLSGNPTVGEWQTFVPALQHAKELGLPVTVHCAEIPNRKEIQAMIDAHPQRLGHACYLVEEDWERVKLLKIPIEICLSSNVQTGRFASIYDHHFAELYKAQHPMALCTDDCGMFSTTLSNEYYLAASSFGLSKMETFQLAEQAIGFVFADDEVKKELSKIYQDAKNKMFRAEKN